MKRRPSIAPVREAVFARDDWACRICVHFYLQQTPATELAHLHARGMGGSRQRDTTANCIAACRWHHQGPRSLHSGHLKYRCLTDMGADGPMAFWLVDRLPKAEVSPRRARERAAE